jgi:hypothetical protein
MHEFVVLYRQDAKVARARGALFYIKITGRLGEKQGYTLEWGIPPIDVGADLVSPFPSLEHQGHQKRLEKCIGIDAGSSGQVGKTFRIREAGLHKARICRDRKSPIVRACGVHRAGDCVLREHGRKEESPCVGGLIVPQPGTPAKSNGRWADGTPCPQRNGDASVTGFRLFSLQSFLSKAMARIKSAGEAGERVSFCPTCGLRGQSMGD